MTRLFAANRIKIAKEGPPSHPRTRIVEVSTDPSTGLPPTSTGVCVPPPLYPLRWWKGQGRWEPTTFPPPGTRDPSRMGEFYARQTPEPRVPNAGVVTDRCTGSSPRLNGPAHHSICTNTASTTGGNRDETGPETHAFNRVRTTRGES
jgi:hypothetical protein